MDKVGAVASRMLFGKSLQDMVKGIRAAKDASADYIAQCIIEIKEELRGRDMKLKTTALQKLTYVRIV